MAGRTVSKPNILEALVVEAEYFDRNLKDRKELVSVKTILKNPLYKFFYEDPTEDTIRRFFGSLEHSSSPSRPSLILGKMYAQAEKEALDFINLVKKAKEEDKQRQKNQLYKNFSTMNQFETLLHKAIASDFTVDE